MFYGQDLQAHLHKYQQHKKGFKCCLKNEAQSHTHSKSHSSIETRIINNQ